MPRIHPKKFKIIASPITTQRCELVTHEKWQISAQESPCEQTGEHRIFSEDTSATVRTEFKIRDNYFQLIVQEQTGYRLGKAC